MILEKSSVSTLAAGIRNGDVCSVEVVQLCLERIEQLDSEVRAWTTVDAEGALLQAQDRDAEIRGQRLLGPLHGVPVGIKDVFMTRGLRTTMGSPIFEDYVPDYDAVAVARLKKAGAVILGKTVTAQFAALDPGPTRNPWNLKHTPGGSSSGSAAAVAARMCPAATGTQTAGSIGRPAAFCGVVGFMPTASRIPRDGVFPSAWSLDHVGAFARTVADVSILASAMSDAAVWSLGRVDAKDLCLGVVAGYFEENTDADVWHLHMELVERLRRAGAHIVELTLPDIFRLVGPTLRTIMRSELASAHAELYAKHRDRYPPTLLGMIEAGRLTSATEYIQARRLRRLYRKAMRPLFDGCQAILSPGARGGAPAGIGSTGDPVASIPWTLGDFPTLSLPFALNAAGMPVGLQVSGPPLDERRLLTIGKCLEGFLEFKDLPGVG